MTTMNSQKDRKLNHLLRSFPKGVIITQAWLENAGIYRQLADRYCRSQWLKRVGYGAYTFVDDTVNWSGAVHALQQQLGYQIYIGAKTALELQGHTHYVPLGKSQVIWLFKLSNETRKLPKWFQTNFMHENTIHYLSQNLFNPRQESIGLTTMSIQGVNLSISSPERAIIECMDFLPRHFAFEDIQLLMQSMTTLRPQLLQSLLENCQSIKAKRLFLLFADHEKHSWFNQINLRTISLGQGKRMIGQGGYYYPKYQLSVPIKLIEYNDGHTEE